MKIRQRAAPPGFHPPDPHAFRNFCENFDSRSCKVRSPGQAKWPNYKITFQSRQSPRLRCFRESYGTFGIWQGHQCLIATTIPYFNSLWRGKSYQSCYSSRSRGTSILLSSNLQYSVITAKTSDCGNFVVLAVKINNESYLLVNVYGPNEDNSTFYKTLSNTIEEFDVRHIIVLRPGLSWT